MDTKYLAMISNGIPHEGCQVLKRKVPNKLSKLEWTNGYEDDWFDPSYSKSWFHEVSGFDIQEIWMGSTLGILMMMILCEEILNLK